LSSSAIRVTVVVPTLAADDALAGCLRALEAQTLDNFEVVVVDNSGARRAKADSPRVRVIANDRNVGFGAAVNQGFRESSAPYLAALNDDAAAHGGWLQALVEAADASPKAGMFASQVRMAETGKLDSMGMLIAADGSSKQRGVGQAISSPVVAGSVRTLLPAGSAALYRRTMLDEIGLFDETFFLYCEDTDLGLRARWAGWDCLYVPTAIVDHRYSHSAGRASPLKAYYVERNRMYTVWKNFPLPMLARTFPASLVRFFWHSVSLLEGRGKAAEYRREGHSTALLLFLVVRAHVAVLFRLPRLLRERRRIFAARKITTPEFRALLEEHSITLREVAAL
jgi:GT2 family glycosyltransferase